jgi:hypothetical protein
MRTRNVIVGSTPGRQAAVFPIAEMVQEPFKISMHKWRLEEAGRPDDRTKAKIDWDDFISR